MRKRGSYVQEKVGDDWETAEWVEIRYSYNDVVCLRWMWDLRGLCPPPGEEEEDWTSEEEDDDDDEYEGGGYALPDD